MNAPYLAAVCTALSGPASLKIEERTPEPLGKGEIRVAVKAAGLNFPDLLMTYGKYQFRPDPPFVPGLEVAGEIIETGDQTAGFAVGDRVMTGSKGGGFAEQIVVPAGAIKILPPALSFAEGACWQTAAVTAWHALNDKAELEPGQSILVLGASGGVGMSAVKLGKHKGALVIGTASTEEKREVVLNAGADYVLDPADPDLARKVKDLTQGNGADAVFDPVGGELAKTATRAIAWGGRYLIVGFASGEIPSFTANHALIKGYSLMGLRAGESARRNPALAARNQAALHDLAEAGVMRPHISHRYPLADAAEALRILERREAVGRVAIEM
ncbi:NADPH:quinone oxidoreductase family protein [Parasphingorhabdus sp.]|uniref:NADPH:quinone oxidoreductase family protein n=1 Tax=Parasphingorhabdus sp. TaxID=2709688 RepID=UPI0032645738